MIATLTEKLLNKLRRRSYRAAYVDENVRTGIAYQIRALREQRGWSQKTLAEVLGKPQSVVSRIEDPDYGKLSVQTLLEIAEALDIALLIRYVAFPDFITQMRNVTPDALGADSFSEDQFTVLPVPPRQVALGGVSAAATSYVMLTRSRAEAALGVSGGSGLIPATGASAGSVPSTTAPLALITMTVAGHA